MRWSLFLYLFIRLKNVNKIGYEKHVTGGHRKFNLWISSDNMNQRE
jgi:hypothetical protein